MQTTFVLRRVVLVFATGLLLALATACNPTLSTPTPPAETALPAPTTGALATTPTTALDETASALGPAPTPFVGPVTLPDFSLCWVAYSPTYYNPNTSMLPLPSDIRDDLRTLYEAGFQGVVTYGSYEFLAQIPALAREAGMQQVIFGIWDPTDKVEIDQAIAVAPYVTGYIVGNEGLEDKRYELDDVRAALDRVRAATGKPVTTTARIETYYTLSGLLTLGDWLSPTVHPFWHNYFDPAHAAEWTAIEYAKLSTAAPDRPIQFKEVGLPTGGTAEASEANQAEYYHLLQQRPDAPPFVYFEAFDQAWKVESSGEAVEGQWGLFRADRSAKLVVGNVCGKTPLATVTASPTPTPEATPSPTGAPTATPPATATSTMAASATATSAPATETAPTTVYLYGDQLAAGYELNIDNSTHQYGWLKGEGVIQADFLAGQSWAAIFLTVGPPKPEGQRDTSLDLSGCDTLNVDLWAAQPGVTVSIGIKDVNDPDDGSETLMSRTLTTEPMVYQFSLIQFATVNLTQVYLPFEVVYHGSEAATVFIDNIRLTCRP